MFINRELHQKGWTKTAIAEETGFDRKQLVSKYINKDQVLQSKCKVKESKLDAFKPYELQRIQEGTTKCIVLFEEIQAMGYEERTTILGQFVKPYLVQKNKPQ
ncbi:hypothetical protein [Peribacillus butanolivorans]|uniref:hypothetical protein n=1 Tax=Peribacillus butanolivorans TaxID=421767 RepID=UPI00167FC335|nr:hypothetical protein [Peribacillus butanolivorans]QNU03889.1 hypothetical protein GM240_08005 [Peribacillus butanolivorans]